MKDFDDLTMEDIGYDKPQVFKNWKIFFQKNPWIYDWYLGKVGELWKRGAKRASIYKLTNDLRWETPLRADSDAVYKMTSSYCPVYARYIMYRIKKLNGFFEVRKRSKHVYTDETPKGGDA